MTSEALSYLDPLKGPVEYEADVGYPGAPQSRNVEGGETVRRLLQVYRRHRVFSQWAVSPSLAATLCELMGFSHVMLAQSHHNCIMTKHPGFSSATHWHQDIRYWLFDRPELISVWLALGAETPRNGSLMVIPGSHCLHIDDTRFDSEKFLRQDIQENRELIETATPISLNAGDVLCFHCRLFHAAGKNNSEHTKFSVVFTYHDMSNTAIQGTRSSRLESIPLN